MSKENGFYCENPKCNGGKGHVTESEAVECYGRTKIAELEKALLTGDRLLRAAERFASKESTICKHGTG